MYSNCFLRPIAIVYNVPELSANSDSTGFEGRSGVRNLNMTSDSLVGIFNGSIQYWNDSLLVNNNHALRNVKEKIIVVVRRDSSGITSVFTRALAAFTTDWPAPFESFNDGKQYELMLHIQYARK